MPWVSTMTTNLGILLAAGLLIWSVGIAPFLSVALPIIVFAATAGVWLFYVQHQFERTAWRAARTGASPRRRCTQFALPPAPAAALVLRQYRRASRASPCERHSVLSTSGGLAEPSRAGGGRPAQSVEELRLRPIGAVGRGQGTARFLSRGCRTGPGERRCAASFDVEVAIVDLKVAAKLMATGFAYRTNARTAATFYVCVRGAERKFCFQAMSTD